MRVQEQIHRRIDRWGQVVTFSADGGTPVCFKAFIQGLRYKNKMYLNDLQTPIGLANQDYYLYIGPGDQPLAGGAEQRILQRGEERFLVIKTEMVYAEEQICYVWGILRRFEEDL